MVGHTLYLCEKPDQGRIVARALGGGTAKQGAISCPGNVVVTWARGHLLMPFMPQDYDPALARWSWDTLPIVPSPFRFRPRDDDSARQMKVIAEALRGAAKVVIATDADREGELIAYEILLQLKWNGPIERLWLSDLTLPAVQKALRNLKPGAETRPLFHAALARCCADYLVGINMTRAATLKLRQGSGKPLSIGRVQTPVLALIVRLERKLQNFKPEDYFELVAEVATAGGHSLRMRHAPPPEKRILDKAKADALAKRATGAAGPLRVKTEDKKTAPPPLFDLNLLQQAANARYGWSAEHTLKIAQALYETYQATTYPRTDSSALPVEHKQNVPTLLKHLLALPEFAHLSPALARPILRDTVYDDAKVTAHHAIVPTLQATDPARLPPDERRLFLLICRHYLAAHLPDYAYKSTTIQLDANGVLFVARGNQPVFAGWKDAFAKAAAEDAADVKDEKKDDEEDEAATLPPVADGERGTARKVEVVAKKTTPPSRFTEKTLLQAMKNIANYVEDPAAKKRLKQTSGIGTSATRAGIIETLKQREYIVVRKRQLVPTETGMSLIASIEATIPRYADPAETANWEDVLEDIAQSKASWKDFVLKIAKMVDGDLATLRTKEGLQRIDASKNQTPKEPGGAQARKGTGRGKKKSAPATSDRETPLKVAYDDREAAKRLGARWDSARRIWVAPAGSDLEAFRAAGFLA